MALEFAANIKRMFSELRAGMSEEELIKQ